MPKSDLQRMIRGMIGRLLNRVRDPRLPAFSPDQQVLILILATLIIALTLWRFAFLYT